MQKKIRNATIFVVAIIVLSVVFNMFTYTTAENEYTVIKQFGEIKKIDKDAGLGVKIPIMNSVSTISKSTQIYDLPKSEAITSDKKTMLVDAYVLWKVTDPKLFTSSVNASTSTIEGRIDVMVYNAIKTTISSMTQEEIVISRDNHIEVNESEGGFDDVEINDLEEDKTENGETTPDNEFTGEAEVIAISSRLLEAVGNQCDQYGIEITDIKIKVLDLPEENKNAVFNRMITERNNIAAAYTAQGQSEAQKIKNTTDKEVAVMISEAEAAAAQTIAEGEAEYMNILSAAYNDASKADFYVFSLSLDTARSSLKNGQTTLFLDKDSPIAEIFQGNFGN